MSTVLEFTKHYPFAAAKLEEVNERTRSYDKPHVLQHEEAELGLCRVTLVHPIEKQQFILPVKLELFRPVAKDEQMQTTPYYVANPNFYVDNKGKFVVCDTTLPSKDAETLVRKTMELMFASLEAELTHRLYSRRTTEHEAMVLWLARGETMPAPVPVASTATSPAVLVAAYPNESLVEKVEALAKTMNADFAQQLYALLDTGKAMKGLKFVTDTCTLTMRLASNGGVIATVLDARGFEISPPALFDLKLHFLDGKLTFEMRPKYTAKRIDGITRLVISEWWDNEYKAVMSEYAFPYYRGIAMENGSLGWFLYCISYYNKVVLPTISHKNLMLNWKVVKDSDLISHVCNLLDKDERDALMNVKVTNGTVGFRLNADGLCMIYGSLENMTSKYAQSTFLKADLSIGKTELKIVNVHDYHSSTDDGLLIPARNAMSIVNDLISSGRGLELFQEKEPKTRMEWLVYILAHKNNQLSQTQQ